MTAATEGLLVSCVQLVLACYLLVAGVSPQAQVFLSEALPSRPLKLWQQEICSFCRAEPAADA